MKSFALAALAVAAEAAYMTDLDFAYMKYVSEHQKFYNTVEEFEMRKALFANAEAAIAKINSQNGSHTAGHNMFSDMTQAEYNKRLGLRDVDIMSNASACSYGAGAASLDWRDVANVVTPVKDQGACGSCWAFSTMEALESRYVLNGNEQVILAPQQLVDCDTRFKDFNNGCNGGMYDRAYNFLNEVQLAVLESEYPYFSGSTGSRGECAYDGLTQITKAGDYCVVNQNKTDVFAAIANGPVNVALSAGNDVFRYYNGGIVSADAGCPTQIDHAVVAVGYGTENGTDYVIIRNSWSADWGEDGFIRLEAGDGLGTCGMNTYLISLTGA